MNVYNFSWVIENRLAGVRGPTCSEDLAFLRQQGITVLVRLAEAHRAKVTAELVLKAGLEDFHVPVQDYHPPSMEQIDELTSFVKEKLGENKEVAVSCGAGVGRTGTVLTCILISMGYSIEEAEKMMAKAKRYAYETEGQHKAITDYYERTRAIL